MPALAVAENLLLPFELAGRVLDQDHAELVVRTMGLRRGVDELGSTVIMVTHHPEVAADADRVLFFESGRVVTEMREPNQIDVHVHLTALRRRRERRLV